MARERPGRSPVPALMALGRASLWAPLTRPVRLALRVLRQFEGRLCGLSSPSRQLRGGGGGPGWGAESGR